MGAGGTILRGGVTSPSSSIFAVNMGTGANLCTRFIVGTENAELKPPSGHLFGAVCIITTGQRRPADRTVTDQELRALRLEEEQLERLRMLVEPEYWPRIYAMLKRVRDEIKKKEESQSTGEAA